MTTKIESNTIDKDKKKEQEKKEKEYFQLPIYYLSDRYDIDNNIKDDLELTQCKDVSDVSLYESVFKFSNCYGKKTVPLWERNFTNNIDYLKDSQSLLKTFESFDSYKDYEEIDKIWNEVKCETGFHDKYYYISTPWFESLNNKAPVLQIVSLYNLTSPVFSLLLPILFLILPFAILKLKGIEITMGRYLESLKELFSKHALGQFVTQFAHVSWEKRCYLLVSVGFYFLQIYQNVLTCYNFYKNMKKIHIYLFKMKDYIENTCESMDNYLKYTSDLQTYKPFNDSIKEHQIILKSFKDDINAISEYKVSVKKIGEIGELMKCFYHLYKHQEYNQALEYSFGFNGYINNICSLQNHIQDMNMNYCSFSSKPCNFKQTFYPALLNNKPIKNTYNLKKHMLITGPNAAGKTTILKTSLFNIILSQQMGVGFYKSATINPYKYIHCYLNIPDTSGRDSLFQAEARRCKEILTSIENSNDKERHFCIFDELYSGTNPYEAVGSAYSFLTYLTKYKNIDFILTTHYLDLCKRLEQNKTIKNYNMNTIQSKDSFKYTYKLKKGISYIKGGVKVLNDLNYPKEIIDSTKKTINL
jgi:hypothetical protein